LVSPQKTALAAADRRFGFALVAPAVLLVVGLVTVPVVQTLIYSTQKVIIGGTNTFVGLDNFRRLAVSGTFWHSVEITGLYAIGFLVLSTGVGLAMAVLLNQSFPGRPLARALLIVPWASPWLIVGIIWRWFVHPDLGALNAILVQSRMLSQGVPFLADPNWALLMTILAASWRQASLSGLLILAGLQLIPKELPEAARVDGAGTLQRLRFVTLPLLRPVLIVVILTNLISGVLQFDVTYIMTQGGPGDATKVLSILLYQQLFVFTDIGVGSAIAVVLGVVAFAFGLLLVRLLYRTEGALGSESAAL
jgi:multiple sugar transport system permease protein